MEIRYGTLTQVFPDRNFFFIRDDETSRDIFTHVSGFAGKVALAKGTRVRFRVVPNSRRRDELMAVAVEPVEVSAVKQ